MSFVDDVRAFHLVANIPVLDKPRWPSADRFMLRFDLLEEEYRELCDAELSMDEIAKELVDLIYVAIGMALEFGIPLEKVWTEVHKSNMAKADPLKGGVIYREDGKVLKPEGWQKPDIAGVLHEHSLS
jgi:predicted HAD superfamily Cof-like phosphohydrolase